MAASISQELGADDAWAAASALAEPAENYGNDESVEMMWAIKAHEHAEVFFNLLCSVPPHELKLTPHDNRIYSTFREQFPDFDVTSLNEEKLKSTEAKEKWRGFCNSFQDVEDFNFGTLVRLNANQEYSEENSILVTRIQFLAIEIARNREGCNKYVWQHFSAKTRH